MHMNKKILLAVITALVILIAALAISLSGSKKSEDITVTVDITDEKRSELESKKAELEQEIKDTKEKKLYLSLAQVESQLGLLSQSKEHYKKFLQNYPNDQVGLNNYAALLYDMGLYEEAEEAYKGIIGFRGLSLDLLDKLVRSISAQNADGSRTDDLISVLEDSTRELGQIDYIMVKLADIYEAEGQCDLAVEHLEVLRDSSEGDKAALVEKDIENLKERCQN